VRRGLAPAGPTHSGSVHPRHHLPGPGGPGPHRPGPHRPGPGAAHYLPILPCCVDYTDYPPASPPVPAPPLILYIVPSPPALVYIPPPRVEPAPEIVLPNGRLERHGNGVDYPYTWVFVETAPRR
jgi:hypothetical protein